MSNAINVSSHQVLTNSEGSLLVILVGPYSVGLHRLMHREAWASVTDEHLVDSYVGLRKDNTAGTLWWFPQGHTWFTQSHVLGQEFGFQSQGRLATKTRKGGLSPESIVYTGKEAVSRHLLQFNICHRFEMKGLKGLQCKAGENNGRGKVALGYKDLYTRGSCLQDCFLECLFALTNRWSKSQTHRYRWPYI